MELLTKLIKLNKANTTPKKFDTKITCIRYILNFYELENDITVNIFDDLYELRLRQLQHICHKIKGYVNEDEFSKGFEYINTLIKFIQC